METISKTINSSVSKVIIIGGGIGGLTLALACLDIGLEVELYEKRDLETMLGGPGGIFIQRNAMKVYKLLANGKIYEEFYKYGGKILTGGFFNHQAKPLYINSPEFVGETDLGVCLMRSQIQQILYNALPPSTVKTGLAFQSFQATDHGIKVYFQDGTTTTGDILVGADGIYSKVRASLHGQERLEDPIYSGMCCWRGSFDGANLPLNPEYSWMELWGKGNRFGYFHVGGGKFSFYGFTNSQPGENDESVGGPLAALQTIFSAYGEPVPSIIAALDPKSIYRDDIFDRESLGHTWGKGRVTLIGDAAHPVQPTLGQGGCMAIEDAFELAKLLATVTSQEQVSSVLRQFESDRHPRVTKVLNVSRSVGSLAQTDSNIGCLFRNLIYQLTPTWLADQQFKWLFDYNPTWN
ncbi:zeaxanthin epoxidase [Richelia sinica FACHB-800]|uniref:Zeaxanthin epoxidase n=1 Tax=Richelia sinica FACHB-800 TaxID=1357546 RepID=A0A975Y375_9NOST|nr:FAD-dependent monooxygenase [Richelia sinica]MBD2662951.1 FAD-dependent monooxygenase [Richelia sinica FACHB-800]QXE21792.1 zeaxanthin epoxidase [Richelia sinica FACHB-800]